jgi:hypothetical protein
MVCTSVQVIDVDKVVLAIAERFTHYEMRVHLKLLRAYYAARRRRKLAELKEKQSPWDEQLIVEWAALWRIPPFQHVYAQLPHGAPCPCGNSSVANKFSGSTFPEGSTWLCGACGATWLVLRSPP